MSTPRVGKTTLLAQIAAEQAFDPEATRAMGIAFDGACWALGLANKSSAPALSVAHRVVQFATIGERDPWRLRAEVLRSLER
jgi:hypothetical protein